MNPLGAVRDAMAGVLRRTRRALAGLRVATGHLRWLVDTHRCEHGRVLRLYGDERMHCGPYRCRRCGRALRWLPPHSHVESGSL